MFGKVLGHLEIGKGKIVFVGDSVERDVRTARWQGSLTVWYDESGEECLGFEGRLRVDSLERMREILGTE